MLARLPVLLLCLAASVAALSMHHVHRGVAHRAVAHRAVQPTIRRRSDGKRCKVRASSIASSLSSIHKTAVVHEVSTSTKPATTPKAEPTTSKVTSSTSQVESTTSKLEPTTPNFQPTTPKAEPTPSNTSKAESTTPKAEPTTSKAEPSTTEAKPTTTKAEPTTTKAEPTTTKAPAPAPTTTKAPTTQAPAPTTTKAPTTQAPAPTTTKAPTTQAPPPAPTQAPANTPSFLVGTQTGQGTFYSTGLGACGIVNKDTDFIAAVSHLLFDAFPGYNGVNPNTNPLCGKQVSVSYQGKSVTVALTDRCEGCALTDLDFSPSAFDVLADPSVGRLDGITWHWLG